MSEEVGPIESDPDPHDPDIGDIKTSLDEHNPSPILQQLVEATESVSRGDIRNARRIMSEVESSLDDRDLKEPETQMISTLRHQLSVDPVELFLPLFFFCVWALIFWLTLH